jgi:cytochrome c oxidase subunit 1
MRWVTTTNHKDIGTLYLWFSFAMFMVGGGAMAWSSAPSCSSPACSRRAGILQPDDHAARPDHGVRRDHAGLRRLRQLDDPDDDRRADMAFARMNNWSFWLLPPAGDPADGSLFVPGGAAGGGWTLYPPLSMQMGIGMDMAIFAVHILGMSVDHGLDQHRHHDPQHARAGHDADEDAAVRAGPG